MDGAERSATSHAAAARFSRLLDAYQDMLISFAFGMVGERELARDIVQEAFVAAWPVAARHGKPFGERGDDGEARRWLFAVTYRQAALAIRRRRHVAWQSLDGGDVDDLLPPTPDFADGVAEAEALRAALRTLGSVDAACFLLQAVQGFSTDEIAAIVHLRPTAVRKRLSRARQRLRAAYTRLASCDLDAYARQTEAAP